MKIINKKLLSISLLSLSMLFITTSNSFASNLSVGVIVGEPTGLSWKYRTGSSGFAGAAAWKANNQDSVYLHGDYIFHNSGIFPATKGDLSLYYGLGGKVRFLSNFGSFGIRVPIGVDYVFDGAPLNLFAEVVPSVGITPNTNFNLDGAVGIRFRL